MSITIMKLSTIGNQASQKLPWVPEVFSPVRPQASFRRPQAEKPLVPRVASDWLDC